VKIKSLMLFSNKYFFVKLIIVIIIINSIFIKYNEFKQKRIEILQKGKSYINKCLKCLLFRKFINIIEFSKFPKISVIIPIFNCQKTIVPTIRSVQNQNFYDFEIILVNDYSTDNTSEILHNLQSEDPRMIIINNKKNMGTLYSRCIGVLNSKGKYIFPLDNDDMFFDEDVFDYIYKIGNAGNYDIVEFKTMITENYYDNIRKIIDHPLSFFENNLILHQPEIGLLPIYKNGICGHFDINIWGKSIKNEIYKKSVNDFGYENYSKFFSWAEDTIMVFILLNTAQSFIFIHKYGVIHLYSSSTASFTQSDNAKIYGEIFLIDTIFDFSKDNISKNCVIDLILDKDYFKSTKSEKNILYLKTLLKKILNCNYITKFNKERIIKSYFNYFNEKSNITNDTIFINSK
jgi:glycosyltransferase involved in cell wall biosynthesis